MVLPSLMKLIRKKKSALYLAGGIFILIAALCVTWVHAKTVTQSSEIDTRKEPISTLASEDQYILETDSSTKSAYTRNTNSKDGKKSARPSAWPTKDMEPEIANDFIYTRTKWDILNERFWGELVISDTSMAHEKVIATFKPVTGMPLPSYPSPTGNFVVQDTHEKIIILKRSNNDLQTVSTIPQSRRSEELKWSANEKYIAAIYEGLNDDFDVIVYDVATGQQIHSLKLSELKLSIYGDPTHTEPTISWDVSGATLFTSDDTSIYKISMSGLNATQMRINTPEACHGIAVNAETIYCHNQLSTTFIGVKNPADSPFTGVLFKYILHGSNLSGPTRIAEELEGEYDANMYILDDTHILYSPISLGQNTIVNIETKVEVKPGWPYKGEGVAQLFSAVDGAIDTMDRERTVPIIYTGHESVR